MATAIYLLRDPRTSEIRYVGKAVDPKRRLLMHHWRAGTQTRHRRDDYIDRWLRQVLAVGLKATVEVIEWCEDDVWKDRERHWIATLRGEGHPLTNTAAGGQGVDAPRTEEWRRKIGEAHRGKTVSPEIRAKLRRINLAKNDAGCKHGHAWTPENTKYTKEGHRFCKACAREKTKAAYRRKHGGLKGRGGRPACKRGHGMEGYNLRILERRGKIERICRTCVRERNAQVKARRRLRDVDKTQMVP